MKENKSAGGGLSLASVVGVVFIILKLTGNINWPWIWVLCPFWIGIAFVFVVLAVCIVIGIITGTISAIKGKVEIKDKSHKASDDDYEILN